MLSIKKINAGSGYEYLVRSIARGDADYYLHGAAAGDPPGVWAGRGSETLAVSGQAAEDQVRNLFGLGVHPDRPDEPLGAAFAGPSLALDRIRRWESDHPDAAPEERAVVVAAERVRGDRNAIAGLDLTFSPPKSWSVLWAAVLPTEREQMWAAHHTGVDAALAYLQTHAAFTRLGHDGVRQVETGGLTAVRFDHTVSRAGDVQPHSHLLVSTKVQGPDGGWRALDTAQVYAVLAAAGALYSTVRDTETARALGTRHELREDLREREVLGVPEQLRREFSGRRTQIESELAALVLAWQDRHGAPPPPAVRARMSEYLTVRSRPDKRRGESAEQMLARMQRRAERSGYALDAVRDAALGRGGDREPDPDAEPGRRDPPSPADLVRAGLAAVTTERTVWTRWHLLRAIENRQSIDPALSAEQILHRAEALTDAGLAHPDVRRISPPDLLAVPVQLRRRIDDASVFARHGGTVYTTQDLLDAERQLLDAARRRTGVTVPVAVVEQVLAAHATGGAPLDAAQSAAVRRFTLDDRGLDVLEGPAGSGKSRAMRAVVQAWTAGGRDVLGLALSQQAGRVLAEESGARTENIQKFLHHHAALAADPAPGAARPGHHRTPGARAVAARAAREQAEHDRWTLRPGQLVLVDEAAMADTRRMAALEAIVRRAGAVLRAVGDDAQLTAPEAGGWFSLVATDVAALRLNQLHRFSQPWEAEASLRLRAGDPSVLAIYAGHGRIIAGDLATLESAAYTAWAEDERAGRTSLLLVGTNAHAAALSARARADLVTLGRVEAAGVELHDGNLAGVGDRVVTRLNDSRLRDADGRQVANRDHWIVRRRHRDGRLSVERLGDSTGRPTGVRLVLPAAYVAADVELAYAAVKASRQGATVDTSHSLVGGFSDLAAVYVAATRGRHANTLYVETQRAAGEDQGVADTAEAVLARILAAGRATRPVSAHQALRDAQDGATSLATLGPIWDDTVTAGLHDVVIGLLRSADEAVAAAARADPAWPTLLAVARDARDHGWDLDTLLPAAVAERDLSDVEGVAKVLTWRVRRAIGLLDGDGRPLPRDIRPPINGSAGGGAWSSYLERTPTGNSPDLVVARQAAELLDARIEGLRTELASDPPEWATRALGAVPEDPLEREQWSCRAAAVAAYRERYGGDRWPTGASPDGGASPTGGAPDGGDLGLHLLGPRPQTGRREAAQLWEHAHQALGEASELTRLRAAGDNDLHAAVAAAQQALAGAPPHAGEELRDAALRLRGASAAVARLHGEAERVAAQLSQLSRPRRVSDGTRGALQAELDQLRRELGERGPVTEAATARYSSAVAADASWQQWDRRTAAVRRSGRLAAEVLQERVDGRPEGAGHPGGRLADRLAAERLATADSRARVQQALSARAKRERIWRESQIRVLDPDRAQRRVSRGVEK